MSDINVINRTQCIFVDPASGTVSVINAGPVGPAGPGVLSGTGSPEGVVTATVGKLYTRDDGGAGTTLYVKESGAGNTGWVAK